MGHHAENSPSSLSRRRACPGSKVAERGYEDQSGEAAIDGTGTHELLEHCVLTGNDVVIGNVTSTSVIGWVKPDAIDWVGRTVGLDNEDKPEGWVVCKERAKRVQVVLDYMDRRIDQIVNDSIFIERKDVKVYAELKSNPGEKFGRSDWYGTADVVITWNGGQEVIDLKDGRGWVNAENNDQTMSYAGGIQSANWYRDANHEVRATIVQPKTKNPVRFQNFTGPELWRELEFINGDLIATDQPDAPRIPGEHCRYCLHNPKCKERIGAIEQGLKKMTELDKIGGTFGLQVDKLNGAQIGELLDVKEIILARFKEIETEANKRVEADPQAIPGYAMQPGKASRAWNVSDDELIKKFKAMKLTIDEFTESKIKSPAAIEKLDKMTPKRKQNLDKLISTVAGADKLKPVSSGIPVSKDPTSIFADAPAATQTPAAPAPTPAAPAPKKLSFL